jgi:hypothetical protein
MRCQGQRIIEMKERLTRIEEGFMTLIIMKAFLWPKYVYLAPGK